MIEINLFTGEYSFLSNFYLMPIYYEGHLANTLEHHFQAAKAINSNDRIKILQAVTPANAKRMGRMIERHPWWELKKLEVMTRLVRLKFNAHDELARKLLNTGTVELIEGNAWNDTYWGVCRGIGENHLGKILMRVRQELSRRGVT